MGKLTRAQLITQGMVMAGKSTTGLASIVGVEFDAWLRNVYKGWLWPFLNKEYTGLTLTAGVTSKVIGGGQGGVTEDIQEVFDPLYIYTADYTQRGEVRVRNLRGDSVEFEPSALNSATTRGMPHLMRVMPSTTTWGQVTLVPYPFPDKAYLLTINAKFIPASVADGAYPLYDNDRTLLAACCAFTLKHMKDPAWTSELDLVAALVAQDRGADGVGAGLNQKVGLDTRTFRKG